MAITLNHMNMKYKNNDLDKVQVMYRIAVENEDLSGRGQVEISPKDFDEGKSRIVELAKEHFFDKLDGMEWKIEEMSINENEEKDFDKPEVDYPVNVVFSGKSKYRELKVNGNFYMSIKEYEENSGNLDLKEKAKEYTEDISLED